MIVAIDGPAGSGKTTVGRLVADAVGFALVDTGLFYRAVTVDPFPCRDQRVLFKREIAWVRRCGRTLAECAHPRCMDAIEVDAVTAAIASLVIELG